MSVPTSVVMTRTLPGLLLLAVLQSPSALMSGKYPLNMPSEYPNRCDIGLTEEW